jgi:hypothetical protein
MPKNVEAADNHDLQGYFSPREGGPPKLSANPVRFAANSIVGIDSLGPIGLKFINALTKLCV